MSTDDRPISSPQTPWPASYLLGSSWHEVRHLLGRTLDLARRDALPAVLMLVGEAGLGREALALEMAAGLVCREDGGPECRCGSCARVRRGVHPDVDIVSVLPGRAEILIDEQIRPLTNSLGQRPFEGRRRVVIIDSCHTPPLNVHAASALLKTLEEPPSYATIMLLASNPARALPTIVSRSVQLRVPAPDPSRSVELIAFHHGCDGSAAKEMLEAMQGDVAAALVAESEKGLAVLRQIPPLVSETLSGSGLALVRLGGLLRSVPGGLELAARSALSQAESGTEPEAALDTAAALLAAGRRASVLHLDGEHVLVGALAAMTATAGGRTPESSS
ncbi:MAG: hypothetical protein AB1625_14575 [Acidobacteriota bacterium]